MEAPRRAESPFAGLVPAVAIAGFVFVAGMVAFYAPPPTGEMAVVFPFGTDQPTAYHLILAAGGKLVSGSRFSNILIAYATDSGFSDRVRGEGPLVTLAAKGLCGPVASPTQV